METKHSFSEDDAKQALKILWKLKCSYDDIEINKDTGLIVFMLMLGLIIGFLIGKGL